MYSDRYHQNNKIIIERKKASKIGKYLWLCIMILGILGLIFWKWYSILIAIAIAFIVGSLYSYSVAKRVQKETGFNIYEQESAFKNSKIEDGGKNGHQ